MSKDQPPPPSDTPRTDAALDCYDTTVKLTRVSNVARLLECENKELHEEVRKLLTDNAVLKQQRDSVFPCGEHPLQKENKELREQVEKRQDTILMMSGQIQYLREQLSLTRSAGQKLADELIYFDPSVYQRNSAWRIALAEWNQLEKGEGK